MFYLKKDTILIIAGGTPPDILSILLTMGKKTKIAIIIILLVVFFTALNLTNFSKTVKNLFYLLSSPIQKTLLKMGDKTSDFLAGFFQAESLKKENENYQLKIQELLAKNTSLPELKKENEVLREALKLGLEKDIKLVLAEVIGKDVSQDYILIDEGFQNGTLEGMPVITEQRILVGKISEVYKNFSKVILISNPKISFDAEIADSEIFGMVKGKGNLNVLFDLIPREKQIEKGEVVITSALGGIFPKGLLVGETAEVRKSDIEPFQTAQIKPAFDFSKIEKLFIISEF